MRKKCLCENCLTEIKKEPCSVCGFTRGIRSDDPSSLPRGTKLGGRYILGGLIGRGGFGNTYVAYDTKIEKTLCVKEYFPRELVYRSQTDNSVVTISEKVYASYKDGADSFFKESEQVSQFNGNPNIVNVYESFCENNTAYFAMEYLRGITLEKYVTKYGALSEAQTVYITEKLAAALVAVHSAGLLHRDVSPDNIMLCEDGKVKLIDFGAARKFSHTVSPTLTVMMKTGFTAVEQYSDKGYFGAWTDIYSVGAVMYYALTGRSPATPYARMEDESVFSEEISFVSEKLRAIIEKAASINSAERYKTAAQLGEAVSALDIVPEEIKARPDDISIRVRASSAREKKQGRAPFVVCAGITAAAVITSAAVVITSKGGENESSALFAVISDVSESSSAEEISSDAISSSVEIIPSSSVESSDESGEGLPPADEDKAVTDYTFTGQEIRDTDYVRCVTEPIKPEIFRKIKGDMLIRLRFSHIENTPDWQNIYVNSDEGLNFCRYIIVPEPTDETGKKLVSDNRRDNNGIALESGVTECALIIPKEARLRAQFIFFSSEHLWFESAQFCEIDLSDKENVEKELGGLSYPSDDIPYI